MSTSTSFTHAAEQAQHWVKELAGELHWNEQRALRLLRAVMHTLRDHLSREEMRDLSAQLPVLIRGIYFEGFEPSAPAAIDRTLHGFVVRFRQEFGYEDGEEINVERAIAAMFKILDRHISRGEIEQVRNSMKKSLRQLWPQ